MILIALGSNLPGLFQRAEDNIESAIAAMEARGIHILARSRIWQTTPVPVSDQPDYKNAVVSIETGLDPEPLLKVLLEIERKFGRVRGDERNAARTLDLDILTYHSNVIATDTLDIPHPRLHERLFVLQPLCEIYPEWSHPVLGKTSQELLKALKGSVLT